MTDDRQLLELALEAAAHASRVILEVYRSGGFDAQAKDDASPVTRADLEADVAIAHVLDSSGLPVVSEESCAPYEERRGWRRYWLVDPLDGTKDFLARDDEFTVNIALIAGASPQIGVVQAPALGLTYFASCGEGAFRLTEGERRRIRNDRLGPPRIAAVSRLHEVAGPLDDFCARHGIIERRPFGSALKLCKLAEGEVDVYPRFAGSCEWDIAAGHAIALEADCRVVDAVTGAELAYNKPDIRNPAFIAHAARLTGLAS